MGKLGVKYLMKLFWWDMGLYGVESVSFNDVATC
jgi:hypothetical protein